MLINAEVRGVRGVFVGRQIQNRERSDRVAWNAFVFRVPALNNVGRQIQNRERSDGVAWYAFVF
jgi:hypothetical protein